jgi:hypothetical protein
MWPFDRWREHRLAEADALSAVAALPGFTARAALVGDDRRAALVVGERGRVAVVDGAKPRAREIAWGDIRATDAGLRIGAEKPVLVAGVNVLDVRRLGDDDWRKR